MFAWEPLTREKSGAGQDGVVFKSSRKIGKDSCADAKGSSPERQAT